MTFARLLRANGRAVALCALALAACSVERVEPTIGGEGDGPAPEAAAAPTESAQRHPMSGSPPRTTDRGTFEPPVPEQRAGDDERAGHGDGAAAPAVEVPAFPVLAVDEFGGCPTCSFRIDRLTDDVIATALREACDTPEPCVDWDLREEPSNHHLPGTYVRSEPPAGAAVAEGARIVFWRAVPREGADDEHDGAPMPVEDGADDGAAPSRDTDPIPGADGDEAAAGGDGDGARADADRGGDDHAG